MINIKWIKRMAENEQTIGLVTKSIGLTIHSFTRNRIRYLL